MAIEAAHYRETVEQMKADPIIRRMARERVQARQGGQR